MKNNHYNVSIIIPVKNEEKRLSLCLDAIRQLEYDKELVEIIVVDNGSNDSTVKIAEKYNCNVYVDSHSSIAGLRNLGAKHASGNILCFVDADVIVSPFWLIAALRHFENPNIACVTGLINIPSNHTWVEKTWSLNRKTKKEVFAIRWASSMNMLTPRKLFNKVGGFSELLVTGEDVNLSSKFTNNNYQIIFDNQVSVIHIGEAKTIRQFIKKERWRGYSDLDLLIAKDFKLSNLKNATQPLFFIFSWVLLFLSIIFGNVLLIGVSCFLILFLPLLKTIIVSKKQSTIKYFFSLLLIWLLYYFARSVAIFDNLKDKLKY